MEAVIRSAAHRGGAVLWSRHAIGRVALHRLSREEVEMSLAACTTIEMYPDGHRQLPDCLVLAWLRASDPLHAAHRGRYAERPGLHRDRLPSRPGEVVQ
jgi:hypothetical protein